MKGILLVLMILTAFASIGIVSASGLQMMVGNYSLNATKTVGVAQNIVFSIVNTEAYSFYNITFDNASSTEIKMATIPELQSGQVAQVTGTIIGDSDFSQNVTIYGYRMANVGVRNLTIPITVDFQSGVNPCSLSVVKGDTVVWQSTVPDVVQMINVDTGATVTTISANSNYSSKFESPSLLKYSFSRRGYQFSNVCQVTALSDSGLINDPTQNTGFYLSVKTNYEQTVLNITYVPTTSYSMNFYGTTQGTITIQNTGAKIAKSVHLDSGDSWFGFSPNDFDLDLNETKVVTYTIQPQVTQTNQTNQTHMENVSITGNFPTVSQQFSVYVSYADLANGIGNESNVSSLIDMICQVRPDLCNTNKQVVYKYITGNNSNDFNVTFSQQQVRDMFAYLLDLGDNVKTTMTFTKENVNDIQQKYNSTDQRISNLEALIKQTKTESDNSQSSTTFVIMFIMVAVICVLLIALIMFYIRLNRAKKVDKW